MAAGATYTPLATTTLGSSSASVTFSSIAGTYTDLVIVCNAIASAAANYELTFNSDTGANYSRTTLQGDGSTALSSRSSSTNFIRCDQGGNLETTFGNPLFVSVMNYSNATTYKTILSRSGGGSSAGGTGLVCGLWRSTATITSLNFACSGASFSTGSTFTLYGISAA